MAATRRNVLLRGAGTVAASIAASSAALAAHCSDAALLALREPYERTLAIMAAASAPHSEAEDQYFVMKALRPDLDEEGLRDASGLDIAEAEYYRALDANTAIIRQIEAQPARSLAGLIFKAEISKHESNAEPGLVASIVDDLLAMRSAA